MARSSSLELDFFNMEKKDSNGSSPAPNPPVFQRKRSFRDMQGVITKMKPELVKSVIANIVLGSNRPSVSVPSTPKKTQIVSPSLTLYDPKLSLHCGCENSAENTAPLTIFYHGMVAVFQVSPHQAQNVLKVAKEILPNKSAVEYFESQDTNILESLDGDLPISRRNSLQRFLEKRKGRLTTLSPCYFPSENCYPARVLSAIEYFRWMKCGSDNLCKEI